MIRKLLPYLWLIVFIYLFALAQYASADDRVCWRHPTERKDGTELAVSEIRGTVLRWKAGLDASTLDDSMEVIAPLTCQVIARNDGPSATRCYSAATIDTEGRQSSFTAWRADRCAVNPEPPPEDAPPRVPTAITIEPVPAL